MWRLAALFSLALPTSALAQSSVLDPAGLETCAQLNAAPPVTKGAAGAWLAGLVAGHYLAYTDMCAQSAAACGRRDAMVNAGWYDGSSDAAAVKLIGICGAHPEWSILRAAHQLLPEKN